MPSFRRRRPERTSQPRRPIVLLVRVVAGLLMALALMDTRAHAQGHDAGATPVPSDASRRALGDIGEQADAVAAQLRSLTEAVADASAVAALESEVSHYRQTVSDRWSETDRMFEGTPRRTPLEALASSWRILRIELVDLQAAVGERVHRREADLATLDRLRQWWSSTRDYARHAGVPDAIVARVEAILATIEATRVQVEQRHARLLLLQDSLSRSVEACDQAAARIEGARRRALARLFVQHQLPLWQSARAWATRQVTWDPLAHASREAALRIDGLRIYLAAYWRESAFTLVLLLVFSVTLYRTRARARRTSGSVALPESVADVFRAPFPTALLLTLFASRPLRPDPPLVLGQILLLIVTPAALALLRPLIESRLLPPLYALAFLLVIDVVRGLLLATPVFDQVVLILEMGAAAALLWWLSTRLPTCVDALTQRSPWLRAAGRRLFRVVAIAATAAAVAALLGYLELADLVGGGGLYLVYVGIDLLGVRIAAGGALGLVLVKSPLARLRTVQAHGARIEHALGRILDILVIAFWIFVALQLFELLDPAAVGMRHVLHARLQVGALDVSIGRILGVSAVVILAWLTSRIVVFALDEDVYARLDLPRGVPYALSSLTRYGLLLLGFCLALGALGFDLTRLTILVSAFGLGVGFGLQQIINNFVSGLILLFERPVQVGDAVQLGDLLGHVMRIGIRSSTIRTFDGAEVIVPNANLLEEKVTNWTLSDRKRRVDVDIGVAYGTDAARVMALLVDVARQVRDVLSDPAPEALFVGFGDSSLNFQLRVWTAQPTWARLRSDLAVGLQRALHEAEIEVPFPQRDLHVRSIVESAAPAAGPFPPAQRGK